MSVKKLFEIQILIVVTEIFCVVKAKKIDSDTIGAKIFWASYRYVLQIHV